MEIIIPPSIQKKLAKIGHNDIPKVKHKLSQLQANPLAGKPLKGEYAGYYSLRAWPLRIVYEFDPKNQTINILDIDYRGQVYK